LELGRHHEPDFIVGQYAVAGDIGSPDDGGRELGGRRVVEPAVGNGVSK
jgi:hypothetical protein